jgi:hypothetical protein
VRSDFLADKRKFFRHYAESGLGDFRYYLCPPGIISVDDLPEHWGLLWLMGERIKILKEAEILPKAVNKEISILVSLIRRIGSSLDGVSIKNYFIPTKNRATALIAELPEEEK